MKPDSAASGGPTMIKRRTWSCCLALQFLAVEACVADAIPRTEESEVVTMMSNKHELLAPGRCHPQASSQLRRDTQLARRTRDGRAPDVVQQQARRTRDGRAPDMVQQQARRAQDKAERRRVARDATAGAEDLLCWRYETNGAEFTLNSSRLRTLG